MTNTGRDPERKAQSRPPALRTAGKGSASRLQSLVPPSLSGSEHSSGDAGHPISETGNEAGDRLGLTRKHKQILDEVQLRILATTDVHANIMSYDYAANRPLNGQGLAQMSILIDAARAEVPSALLLDNGDFLQGTALADLAARVQRRRKHPVISAMNALAYDAATLGNHEFNFGLEVLGRALAEANFPVVSSNVLLQRGPRGPLEDETLVPPYVILDRDLPDATGQLHRLRIGILGLTPPEIMRWDHLHLAGKLEARPMIEAARAWVPQLRNAGADLVICLAHTGIADRPDGGGRDGLGADLAEVPGIDVLVLGHSHMTFPHRGPHLDGRVDPAAGQISGIPVVQAGYSGSHLGIMDLRLGRKETGGWSVIRPEVRAVSVSEMVAGLSTADLRRRSLPLRRVIEADHRAALAWTRRSLGRTDVPLSTAFSQVADTAAMRLLGLAKIDRVRHALYGTPHQALPVLATATPYRAGGLGGPLNYTDIPPGPLSVRNIFDLYPFPNNLTALLVTGADIREDLERAAALYAQITPGRRDQMLIDRSFPSHAFTTIIGVSYGIDLTQPSRYDPRGQLIRPEARRIVNLRRGGETIRRDQRFVLATNSFRISGPLGADHTRPEQLELDQTGLSSDRLGDFIAKMRVIRPPTLAIPDRWRLRALPGTSVLYEAGPGAMQHRYEAAHLAPELVGMSADGFHLLRLRL